LEPNSRAYRASVVLSGASVAAALLRETLIAGLLGFSERNDRLQAYLSIIYTISLLVESTRLAGLSLFGRAALPRVASAHAVLGLPVAFALAASLAWGLNAVEPGLVVVAGLGGYLNLAAALLITHRQWTGRFLAAHVASVLPNVVLIPGVLVLLLRPATEPVTGIVVLYALVPAVQIASLLLFVRPRPVPVAAPPPTLRSLFGSLMAHGVLAVGSQIYQAVLRVACLGSGTGTLAVMALLMRIHDAARFVAVDTYLASRIASWAREPPLGRTARPSPLLGLPMQLALAAAGLGAALLPWNGPSAFAVVAGLVLALGLVSGSAVRVLYYRRSASAPSDRSALAFGSSEVAAAIACQALAAIPGFPVTGLLWVWFGARPLAQWLVLEAKGREGVRTEEPPSV
jgi:hypothetical protein